MIKIFDNNYIRIDTKNNTLAFYIGGEMPEIIYFGGKLKKKIDLTQLLGNTTITGVDMRDYILSQYGKEDFKEPSIKIKNSNKTFVSNFKYIDFKINKKLINNTSLPLSRNKKENICFILKDDINNITLEIYYSFFDNSDIISVNSHLVNDGNKSIYINKIPSLQLELKTDQFNIYTFDGGWAQERMRHESIIKGGLFTNESRNGSSSNDHNPFILLKNKFGYYGFNLMYSSNHKTSIEIDAFSHARIISGINDFMFEYKIKPHKDFLSPEAFMIFEKNQDTLSLEFHNFIQNHIVNPKYKHLLRPILMNNWEGTNFDFNEQKIIDISSVAKEVGAELFVLDDGWFGHRDNDTSSLGDWIDYKKKTGGIDKLADKIKDLGLLFGIWIEPEMISEDSNLYQIHPEYTMKIPNRTPYLHRNQMMLDLTNKEVKNYVLNCLRNILNTTKANYIKWDYNRNFSDVYSPKYSANEYFHRYILNLYEIMDTITKEYKNVLFEGCAAGGSRFDLAILYYMPQIWASDNTDPYDRIKIQTGTSYAYHQVNMGAHVSASPNWFTKRNFSLQTRFNVACGGNLGYELDPTKFTKKEKEIVKKQIEFYKQNRELFQYGEMIYFKDVYKNDIGGFIVLNTKHQEGFIVLTSPSLINNISIKIPLLSSKKKYHLSGVDIKYDEIIHGNKIDLYNLFNNIEDKANYDLYSVMIKLNID